MLLCRNIGKKARPQEPEELAFSAPAQQADGQARADNRDPRANLAGTESQMSTVSERHANNDESASAPRRRTGHEEITDLAYEAADHTQEFAEEIEDAVSAPPSNFLSYHMIWGAIGCCSAILSDSDTRAQV